VTPQTESSGPGSFRQVALERVNSHNNLIAFFRWLHHIKLVLEPDEPPAAKAYLAVNHAFLGDSVICEVLQLATLTSEKPRSLPAKQIGLPTE
jgi:hypothetical protein